MLTDRDRRRISRIRYSEMKKHGVKIYIPKKVSLEDVFKGEETIRIHEFAKKTDPMDQVALFSPESSETRIKIMMAEVVYTQELDKKS